MHFNLHKMCWSTKQIIQFYFSMKAKASYRESLNQLYKFGYLPQHASPILIVGLDLDQPICRKVNFSARLLVTSWFIALNLNSPLLTARDGFRVKLYFALSAKKSGAEVIPCSLCEESSLEGQSQFRKSQFLLCWGIVPLSKFF